MALAQPANDTGAAAPRPQLTLPSRCYTDPDIYNAELQRIFRKSWQVAGNAPDVAEPGTYLTCRVAGQDIAVVRGRDSTLRAFYNVCQHRGHRLLTGKGKLKVAITCPY
ncbi:MAG: aromatic ring-hydroxylating oxygenase subunit alpha, partial [Alphaproteobacteria bacterium]